MTFPDYGQKDTFVPDSLSLTVPTLYHAKQIVNYLLQYHAK